MNTKNKYQFKGDNGIWHVDEVYDSEKLTITVFEPDNGDFREGWRTVVVEELAESPKMEANAHLIAAAPELLHAAIMAIQSTNPLQVHEAHIMLEAAVEKALNIK